MKKYKNELIIVHEGLDYITVWEKRKTEAWQGPNSNRMILWEVTGRGAILLKKILNRKIKY